GGGPMNRKPNTALHVRSQGGPRPMRTRRFVVIVSAVALATAACSSGGGPAGTTGPTQVAVGTLVASAVPEVTQAPASPASREGTRTGGPPTARALDT